MSIFFQMGWFNHQLAGPLASKLTCPKPGFFQAVLPHFGFFHPGFFYFVSFHSGPTYPRKNNTTCVYTQVNTHIYISITHIYIYIYRVYKSSHTHISFCWVEFSQVVKFLATTKQLQKRKIKRQIPHGQRPRSTRENISGLGLALYFRHVAFQVSGLEGIQNG